MLRLGQRDETYVISLPTKTNRSSQYKFAYQTCFTQAALVRCSLACVDLTHFTRVILIRNSRTQPKNGFFKCWNERRFIFTHARVPGDNVEEIKFSRAGKRIFPRGLQIFSKTIFPTWDDSFSWVLQPCAYAMGDHSSCTGRWKARAHRSLPDSNSRPHGSRPQCH